MLEPGKRTIRLFQRWLKQGEKSVQDLLDILDELEREDVKTDLLKSLGLFLRIANFLCKFTV